MKACIACKHFSITDAFHGGTYTGGDPASMDCNRGRFVSESLSKETPQTMLSAAHKCPHFEVSDLAKSKGWPE